MSSREIESILLSESDSAIDKINELLEINYKETLKELLNVFFNKILVGMSLDIEIMLSNIERVLLNQNINKNKMIISNIKLIIYRFSTLKVNESIELKNIKFRLLDIIRKLNERKEKTDNGNLYNMYFSIIFKERDLSVLELILRQEKNILGRKDVNGNDLFYNILDYYLKLEEDNLEEIEYFYEVIMLFFRLEENVLVKNVKNYYGLLDTYKSKKHVMEISRVLYGFSDIDIINLKRKHDISTKVHDDVIKEMASFNTLRDGRTMVDSHFITIDEEGAMCLDDALSMVENKDGSYYFYVGIIDIPSVIPYQSRTFYDALRRNETLYLCNDVIEMYSPTISHDLCSFVQGKERNAIIYKFLVDPYFNLDLDSLEIIKGILKVGSRLSYAQVNKQEGISLGECKMIENMYFLVSKLKHQNSRKDDYRKLENLIYSEATYHHSLFTDKSISANIVQESMLLTNSAVPRYFNRNGFIYNYRNHKLPHDKEISKEVDMLLKIGKNERDSQMYIELINSIKSVYLNAYYCTENRGHEGLGYDYYSHSTSPARRFSDSFNQYLTYFQVFDIITCDREYYELEETAREVVNYMNDRKKENSKFASEYNYLSARIRTLKK